MSATIDRDRRINLVRRSRDPAGIPVTHIGHDTVAGGIEIMRIDGIWAAVWALNGKEQMSLAAHEYTETCRFIIPFRANIEQGDQIEFEGHVYLVEFFRGYGRRRTLLDVTATRQRGKLPEKPSPFGVVIDEVPVVINGEQITVIE